MLLTVIGSIAKKTRFVVSQIINQLSPIWNLLSGQSTGEFVQGQTSTFTVSSYVSDPNGDSLTISRVGGTAPDNVTVSSSGVVTIPPDLPAGTYSISFAADDGYGAEQLSVSLGLISTSESGGFGQDNYNKPWTFGHPFRKGDVPPNRYITAVGPSQFQAQVRNRWSDGSVKFAVLSGIGGQSALLSTTSTAPSTSNVAEPSVSASVTFSSPATTVDISAARANGLLAWSNTTPHKVREFTGPVMSEFHYYTPVSGDNHLTVWWYVRAYSTGDVEVETVIENGWTQVASPAEKIYTASISVGGTTRLSGQTINQIHHTRWSRSDWVGTDPQILPKHNMTYLRATKLVPNYPSGAPAERSYTGLAFTQYANTATPTPFAQGNFRTAMGGTGETVTDSIGILPHWEAITCVNADTRAVINMLAHARCVGRYSIFYRDETTGRLPRPSTLPNLWYNTGDVNSVPTPTGTASLEYKTSHVPSFGFLAYMLTGRWSFLENLLFSANYHHFYNSYSNVQYGLTLYGRSGSQGLGFGGGENRAQAWSARTLSQAACMALDGSVEQTEFETLWSNNVSFYKNIVVNGISSANPRQLAMFNSVNQYIPPNNLGVFYVPDQYYGYRGGVGGLTGGANFENSFFASVLGYSWDLEINPTTVSYNNHKFIRDHAYRHPIGICGKPSDSNIGGLNWRRAESYTFSYGNSYPYTFFSNWSELSNVNFGSTIRCLGNVDYTSGSTTIRANASGWGFTFNGYYETQVDPGLEVGDNIIIDGYTRNIVSLQTQDSRLINLRFNNSTANSNPGSGNIRFDSTNSTLFISTTDLVGANILPDLEIYDTYQHTGAYGVPVGAKGKIQLGNSTTGYTSTALSGSYRNHWIYTNYNGTDYVAIPISNVDATPYSTSFVDGETVRLLLVHQGVTANIIVNTAISASNTNAPYYRAPVAEVSDADGGSFLPTGSDWYISYSQKVHFGLAYAVDHNAPGANGAYSRLSSASQKNTLDGITGEIDYPKHSARPRVNLSNLTPSWLPEKTFQWVTVPDSNLSVSGARPNTLPRLNDIQFAGTIDYVSGTTKITPNTWSVFTGNANPTLDRNGNIVVGTHILVGGNRRMITAVNSDANIIYDATINLSIGTSYSNVAWSRSEIGANSVVGNGTSGFSGTVDFFDSTALRTNGSYIIVHGGGESGYLGNEIYTLKLNSESPQWIRKWGPTPDANITSPGGSYADGNPASYRSYYRLHYDDSRDCLVRLTSTSASNVSNTLPECYLWNWTDSNLVYTPTQGSGAGQWQKIQSYYSVTPPSDYKYSRLESEGFALQSANASQMARHPVTGDIYMLESGANLRVWSTQTATWSNITTSGVNCGSGGAAVIAPSLTQTHMYVFGDSNATGNAVFRVNLSSGLKERSTLTGTGSDKVAANSRIDWLTNYQASGSADYDPVNKFIYIYRNGQIYRCNTDNIDRFGTNTTESIVLTGNTPYLNTDITLTGTNGATYSGQAKAIFHRFRYVPELDGFYVLPKYDSPVYFFRVR